MKEEQLMKINNWQTIYKIISVMKRKFNDEHKSDYLSFLRLDLLGKDAIDNRKDEMGG